MINDTKELFDEKGNIAVWGKVSSSGRPFYTFSFPPSEKNIYGIY